MKKLIRRIYAYVALGLIVIGSALIVKNSILYTSDSIKSIKSGSYFHIKADLVVPKDHIIKLPILSKMSEITKIDVGCGVNLDCWSTKNYECQIKINDNISVLPNKTKITLDGRCEEKIKTNGLITYRLYTKDNSFVEYIECNSYIENYIGILGDICHVTEKVFTPMSIREFDRVMVVADTLKISK